MKLGPNQIKWLEALRSPDYDQGTGLLKLIPGSLDVNRELYEGDRTLYCCLGVACDVFHWKEPYNTSLHNHYRDLGLKDEVGSFHNNDVLKRVIIDGQIYTSLTEMNDLGLTFSEIADWIEQNPEKAFKESK